MIEPRKRTMKKSKFHAPENWDCLTDQFFIAFAYDLDSGVHDCISEEALIHLKSYKYSSVDKSLISRYVLQHYVLSPSPSHI